MGLARSDRVKYRVFASLTEKQYSNFWRPHDINLDRDREQFPNLLPSVRHVFLNNLAYQSLLDSAQSRAPIYGFLPWVSLPELEACIKVWAFFEEIHNKSYEYIVKNLYSDPTPFIDSILNNTNIMVRADAICRYYDEFIQYGDRVRVFGYDAAHGTNRYEHKRLMYRAMFSVYALEALRFYVSFAYTFAIGQQDQMLGNAKEIKLIARDEALHVAISFNVLKLWPKDDPEFAAIAESERQDMLELMDEVVDQERAWSAYQFSQGDMLGLNETLMNQSLEARANNRLKALYGVADRYPSKTDPLERWMRNWMGTAHEQNANQEADNDAYKISAVNRSIDEASLVTDF